MSSIFDLKTNVNQLKSSNNAVIQNSYDQVSASRSIAGANFPNGNIEFPFELSSGKYWVPNRSYMRVRMSLTSDGTNQLYSRENIGLNMNPIPNLFQSGEFRIQGTTVSRCSDYMAQIDTLEKRLYKSKSWLDGLGKSLNFMGADVKERIQEVSADGLVPSNNATDFQAVNRTTLGFDAATTFAYTQASSTITFADGAGEDVPDVRLVFPVGSYIRVQTAAGLANEILRVVSTPTALTLTVAVDVPPADVAAAASDFDKIVFQAKPSRRVRDVELIWQPPLSIFKVGQALPCGKYELSLNPHSVDSYKKRVIESLLADKTAGTNFDVSITDIYLMVHTLEGPRTDSLSYFLDLENSRVQQEQIDTTSFSAKQFSVSPSTYALTVAFQDGRCGTNSLVSSSKFKSYNAALTSEEELKLNRFYLNYAGENMPKRDSDPAFSTAVDYTAQRYVESMMNGGNFYSSGSAETIEEWQERGPYYHFLTPKEGTDRSTRLTVNQQFNAADVANMRLLVVDHYRSVAKIDIDNGRVINVQLQES